MTEAEFVATRLKAKTDLYFLAKDILGRDLEEPVHRPMTDLFVHKQPGVPFAQLDKVKRRLLLWFRGSFKTTVDEIDVVQWLLFDPNLRLLLRSGSLELTRKMLANVKRYFLYSDKLRTFFPEYALTEGKDDGTADSFTVPCRTNKFIREASVTIATARSAKVGSHYDIIKLDDVVDENNSKTPEGLQGAIEAYDMDTPLLEPHGYLDVIGTFYDPADLYNVIIERDNDREAGGLPKEFKVSIQTAVETDEHGKFTKDSKCYFPSRVDYTFLESVRQKNPYLLACQYLLNPNLEELGGFTMALIEGAMRPWREIEPFFTYKMLDGNRQLRSACVYITWDLASSDSQYSDYRAGAAGLFDPLGRLHIIDCAAGRYTSDELALRIIWLAYKWRTFLGKVGIEDSPGARHLLPALHIHMERMNFWFDIEWIPLGPRKGKPERILALLPLIKQKQLFFNNEIEPATLALLKKQFTRYKPGTRGHEDIPDAISRLVAYRNNIDVVNPYSIPEPTLTACESFTPMLGAGLVGG